MADTISPMIQLEEDCCSKHTNGLLPILNLQVSGAGGGHSQNLLLFYYFQKPMANWQLMHANSAMSADVNRPSLTQYGL